MLTTRCHGLNDAAGCCGPPPVLCLTSCTEPQPFRHRSRRLRSRSRSVCWLSRAGSACRGVINTSGSRIARYTATASTGTVREDYSENGDAWNYFTHDQARSRAYRWGEHGITGLCDERMLLYFALAPWNGQEPILKERIVGLTNPEGNHGEDVKEYYFYVDSTPTHSYMKLLYKYPQAAYPYQTSSTPTALATDTISNTSYSTQGCSTRTGTTMCSSNMPSHAGGRADPHQCSQSRARTHHPTRSASASGFTWCMKT
jgi:hypothetical protein